MSLLNLFKPKPNQKTKIIRLALRILFIILILFGFILALDFIKIGILNLAEEAKFSLTNYLTSPLKSLGIGWLASFVIFSGAPIAVLSGHFLTHGILEPNSVFYLILGSRIGLAAIIFFLGLIFFLKGKNYYHSAKLGLIAFLISISVAFLATILGKIVSFLQIDQFFGNLLFSDKMNLLDRFLSEGSLGEIAARFSIDNLGPVFTVIIGLILIVVLIELLERVFYILEFKKHSFHKSRHKKTILRFLKKPHYAFLTGLCITALTLSSIVSITLLIPFYSHESMRERLKDLLKEGTIAQRILIPYIMGALLGSYIEIFIFTKISGNYLSSGVVFNAFFSSLLALGFLALIFRLYSDLIVKISNWMLSHKSYLPELIILLFILPLLLIFH